MVAAAAPHWVLTTQELLGLGLTANQIAQRARTGQLFRCHRGVWAVGRPDLSYEGRALAAARACGPEGIAFGVTAAALWGIRDSAGVIHVAAPRSRVRHPGVIVHRPRALAAEARTTLRGIPVTTVARTLLDLAACVLPMQVGWAMHEAAVKEIFEPRAVLAELERNPNHRGRRLLGRLLEDEVAPTRSGLERAGLKLVRSLSLPGLRTNFDVFTDRREEVDVCCPSLRLIVEWDGGRYHATRWRRRRDAEKTARLEEHRWRVLRFSDLEVELEPERVAADICAAAAGLSKSRQT